MVASALDLIFMPTSAVRFIRANTRKIHSYLPIATLYSAAIAGEAARIKMYYDIAHKVGIV